MKEPILNGVRLMVAFDGRHVRVDVLTAGDVFQARFAQRVAEVLRRELAGEPDPQPRQETH